MESDINIYYVYCISNNDDGKMYIGYTKQFERRIKDHCKSEKVIGRAIRKHGKENFTFQKLLWFDTEAKAKDTERYIISELNTLCPFGYNVHEGGSGGNTMAGANEEKKKERNENISKGVKEAYIKMTPQEIKEWKNNLKEGHSKRSLKEEALRREKISKAQAKRTPQEKAKSIEKQLKTKANKSDEEKAQSIKRRLETIENKTQDEKEKTKIKKSKSCSGQNNPRYIYLTLEQKSFVKEKRNEGLSYKKIIKTRKFFLYKNV